MNLYTYARAYGRKNVNKHNQHKQINSPSQVAILFSVLLVSISPNCCSSVRSPVRSPTRACTDTLTSTWACLNHELSFSHCFSLLRYVIIVWTEPEYYRTHKRTNAQKGLHRDLELNSQAPLAPALDRLQKDCRQGVPTPSRGGTYQMSGKCLVCSKVQHHSTATSRSGTCQEWVT